MSPAPEPRSCHVSNPLQPNAVPARLLKAARAAMVFEIHDECRSIIGQLDNRQVDCRHTYAAIYLSSARLLRYSRCRCLLGPPEIPLPGTCWPQGSTGAAFAPVSSGAGHKDEKLLSNSVAVGNRVAFLLCFGVDHDKLDHRRNNAAGYQGFNAR